MGAAVAHTKAGEPRCPACQLAALRYNKRRLNTHLRAQHRIGIVPAAPAAAHLHALAAAGFTWQMLATHAGVSIDTIRRIAHGAQRTHRRVHEQILTVPIPTLIHPSGRYIDPTGSRRRIQALQALGWPLTTLGAHINVPYTELSALTYRHHHTTAHRAATIEHLYNQLSMTPGPSQRARAHAQAHGYAPPLAWDDDTITNPNAQPHTDAHTDTPRTTATTNTQARPGTPWARLPGGYWGSRS